jgi:hypothetical protein
MRYRSITVTSSTLVICLGTWPLGQSWKRCSGPASSSCTVSPPDAYQRGGRLPRGILAHPRAGGGRRARATFGPHRSRPRCASGSGSLRWPAVSSSQSLDALSCVNARRWADAQCFPSSRWAELWVGVILPTFCPTNLYRPARPRISLNGQSARTTSDQGERDCGQSPRTSRTRLKTARISGSSRSLAVTLGGRR